MGIKHLLVKISGKKKTGTSQNDPCIEMFLGEEVTQVCFLGKGLQLGFFFKLMSYCNMARQPRWSDKANGPHVCVETA
jgi:hypothetical protein